MKNFLFEITYGDPSKHCDGDYVRDYVIAKDRTEALQLANEVCGQRPPNPIAQISIRPLCDAGRIIRPLPTS